LAGCTNIFAPQTMMVFFVIVILEKQGRKNASPLTD
jgi:hypothetical protein